MNRSRLPRLLLAIALLGLALSVPAAGDYAAETARLEQVRERIEAVQRELERDRRRLDSVSSELRRYQRRVGEVAGRLRQLDLRHAEKAATATALREELAGEERHMSEQRELLARQLRAAYANGATSFLKTLLNQEDPGQVDRMLAYHGYFNRARVARVNETIAQLRRLVALESSLTSELAALEKLRREQELTRRELDAARQERARVQAKLESEISAKGRQLTRLQADERELEALLGQLRNALADIPDDARARRQPFGSRRGQLAWPVDGQLGARFGQARGVGELRWSGLLIHAGEGSGVKAVSPGHVVFADWLRGFGLLLIIDHGDGFMTLYGHNEAVYKEAGDWVRAGEVIASVGAGGGRHHTGLYFEIRAGGKPVDPLEWLRPRRGA